MRCKRSKRHFAARQRIAAKKLKQINKRQSTETEEDMEEEDEDEYYLNEEGKVL